MAFPHSILNYIGWFFLNWIQLWRSVNCFYPKNGTIIKLPIILDLKQEKSEILIPNALTSGVSIGEFWKKHLQTSANIFTRFERNGKMANEERIGARGFGSNSKEEQWSKANI